MKAWEPHHLLTDTPSPQVQIKISCSGTQNCSCLGGLHPLNTTSQRGGNILSLCFYSCILLVVTESGQPLHQIAQRKRLASRSLHVL